MALWGNPTSSPRFRPQCADVERLEPEPAAPAIYMNSDLSDRHGQARTTPLLVESIPNGRFLAGNFHSENHLPLRCAKVLHDAVTEPYFEAYAPPA